MDVTQSNTKTQMVPKCLGHLHQYECLTIKIYRTETHLVTFAFCAFLFLFPAPIRHPCVLHCMMNEAFQYRYAFQCSCDLN